MKALNTNLWKEDEVKTEDTMTVVCLEIMCGTSGCACVYYVTGCP